MREHGPVFADWAAAIGVDDAEGLDEFEEHYLGYWDAVEDYAEQLAEDFGVTEALDRADLPFKEYIDIDIGRLARDLAIELIVCPDGTGVQLFSPR
jgi:antirestriction protein